MQFGSSLLTKLLVPVSADGGSGGFNDSESRDVIGPPSDLVWL
jgi:hypothetical protein